MCIRDSIRIFSSAYNKKVYTGYMIYLFHWYVHFFRTSLFDIHESHPRKYFIIYVPRQCLTLRFILNSNISEKFDEML